MRKLIAFDDETLDALTMLGRDRMATLQDLADEAFNDLLRKHDRPVDLRAALKASARQAPDRGDRRLQIAKPRAAQGKPRN